MKPAPIALTGRSFMMIATSAGWYRQLQHDGTTLFLNLLGEESDAPDWETLCYEERLIPLRRLEGEPNAHVIAWVQHRHALGLGYKPLAKEWRARLSGAEAREGFEA